MDNVFTKEEIDEIIELLPEVGYICNCCHVALIDVDKVKHLADYAFGLGYFDEEWCGGVVFPFRRDVVNGSSIRVTLLEKYKEYLYG